MWTFVRNTYGKIKSTKRRTQLFILLSFLVTFLIIRVITHLQKAGIIPNQHGMLHIHHLVPGIFAILLSGYIGLSYWDNVKLRLTMSILFGIGAALTIDEFALWLFLRDVYWAKQGRDSVDAAIITILLLSITLLISTVYNHAWIKKFFRR